MDTDDLKNKMKRMINAMTSGYKHATKGQLTPALMNVNIAQKLLDELLPLTKSEEEGKPPRLKITPDDAMVQFLVNYMQNVANMARTLEITKNMTGDESLQPRIDCFNALLQVAKGVAELINVHITTIKPTPS